MRQATICIILVCISLLSSGAHPIRNRIEIDTSQNRLYVYHGLRCIRSYPIASGMKEKVTINGKVYNFKTPKGNFVIWDKKENPVWTPPDWNYPGGDVPPISEREKVSGRLGSRALYVSYDGIMIHGTEDETTIGKYVTHGCIRLSDTHLREVYQLVNVGARVWIY